MKFTKTNNVAHRINSKSISRPCDYGTGRYGTERTRLNLAASTHRLRRRILLNQKHVKIDT